MPRVLGVFTRKEYRKLLGILHPDNFDDSKKVRAAEVFNMVKDHENELCTERPKPVSDVLPKTREELIARRQEMLRRKAVERAMKKKEKEAEARRAAEPRRVLT